MCFGIGSSSYSLAKMNVSRQRISTVLASTASMLSIERSGVRSLAGRSGFTIALHVKTTSSAVNGAPSCQVTPFRSR